MKTYKSLFIALICTIPILLALLVLCWKPWKHSGELTARESIGLTNAVQNVTVKPIIKVAFSDVDNRAFIQTGFVTNKNGSIEPDGYCYECGLSGWKFIDKPVSPLNR